MWFYHYAFLSCHLAEINERTSPPARLNLAKGAFPPFDPVLHGKVHDGTGFLNRLQILQSCQQDPSLKVLIKRVSHGMTQRKSYQKRSRWLNLFGDHTVEGDGNRGDTLCLDGPLDQPHRLIAGASGGRHEHSIHPIRL